MSGKYALIIGNTEYSDPGLAQLTAPGKDAEDFARVLRDQDICAFDDVNVLLNQPEYTVRGAIDEFFDQKKPDDMLVLYFSGHGVRDELGSLYLAVKNTIRTRLRSTAIKSDYVREAMDHSRSRRQVLILDCCNSGAFEQGTKAATGVSIGTASAFEAGYGRIILTASDSTQFAWEGNKVMGDTDNSLFTHFLVNGLEGEADLDGDGHITVDELYDYAYEKIRFLTPKQTPSKFSSKQQGEIVLRQIRRIEDIRPLSLPEQLTSEIENPYPEVRLRGVQQLARLLNGKNLGLARSARAALERMAEQDDSRQVAHAATQVLELIRPTEQAERQRENDVNRVTGNIESDRIDEAGVHPSVGETSKKQLESKRLKNENILGEEKRVKPQTLISKRFTPILAIAFIGCIVLSVVGSSLLQKIPQVPTPTSSPTEHRTPIITASSTIQPSQTAQPSSTPPVNSYVYVNVSQVSMYQGPGVGYYLVEQAIYKRGEKLTVIARNPSGLWLLAEASDGNLGWLYIEWLEFTFDPSAIPTASSIPLIPLTPTRKPNQLACNPPPECSGGYDPVTCTCN